MRHNTLTIDKLHKSFGTHHAVRGISLSISQGECVGILGPNGAGKSTTIQMCLGTVVQDDGKITLLDYAIPKDILSAKKHVGVVPQMDNLDPDFTCAENLIVYSRYFGTSLDKKEVKNLLAFANLSERENDKISTLSGGMKRRLTLARALVNNPQFIFLDEPTTGLDPQARLLIWERLRNLQENGKTLLLTTHFMEEAERLCDRLYIMDNGHIIAEGKTDKLISENVEKEVVEIYEKNAISWLSQHPHLYERHETFGQVSYCYNKNAEALTHALKQTAFRFIHRPTNLEDVFLKITGRDLRE